MTFSIWSVFLICISVFGFAAYTAAYYYFPERYPFNLCELLGWVFCAMAIVFWELAR